MLKRTSDQQLLSRHYSLSKKQFQSQKLNLFGKAIAVIDLIEGEHNPTIIKEIDLSHNSIHSLQNIQQFSNLQVLNLSHNRITEYQQIVKLNQLSKLRILFVKGNPFLKYTPSNEAISLLASIDADVDIISREVKQKIEQIVKKIIQYQAYLFYSKKVDLHIQLMNNFQMEDSFINTNFAMFPKIRKLLELGYLKEIQIKKTFVGKIDKNLFNDQNKLIKYLNSQQQLRDIRRSEVIKKIYEREEILRTLRNNYSLRVKPKKIISRNTVNFRLDSNENTIQILKEKSKEKSNRKNNMFQKKQINKLKTNQNSPPKLSSSLSEQKDYEFFQQTYMNILCKMSPVYHLLHSPLHSLKSNQKEILIQNLSTHLKQKMKELVRLDKVQQQNISIKQQLISLKQHLEEMSNQIMFQEQKTSKKLKEMTKLYEEQSDRVEQLNQQIEHYRQQIERLKNINSKLMDEKSQYQKRCNQKQQQNRRSNIIFEKHQIYMKQSFLNLLQYKAIHFKNLHQLKIINQRTLDAQTKREAFNQLKNNRSINQSTKCLNRFLERKRTKIFLTYLIQSSTLLSKSKYLMKKRVSKYQSEFIVLFCKLFSLKKINYQKITLMKSKIFKNIKRKIFNKISTLIQQNQSPKQRQQMQKIKNILGLRKYFRYWKRFMTEHYEKSDRLIESVENNLKIMTFFKLVSVCGGYLQCQTKYFGLMSFLTKFRKINGFHKFSKTLSVTLFQREMKYTKIIRSKLHTYFNYFIKTARDQLLKRKLLVQRQISLRKKYVDNVEEQKRKEIAIKNKIKYQMKKLVKVFKKKIIQNILLRQKAGYDLQVYIEQGAKKEFYKKLRNKLINKLKLKIKIAQLAKPHCIFNKIKSFFQFLSLNRQKAVQFRLWQQQKRMTKSFFRWKAFILWNRMESYRQRFTQLQPQIIRVSELQREVSQEKIMLIHELEQKQFLIESYIKRCQDYEFVLQSKQLKYEKLKDIYASCIRQQEFNSTIKVEHNKTVNRKNAADRQDIYKKYLPNNIDTKFECIEDPLIRVPSAKQQNGQKINNQNQLRFVSSFRRF